MKHLPYHLRSNKSVDRYLLIEALQRVIDPDQRPASEYTYIGFGGPFLEDMKVVEHFFPEMRLISLEKDKETVKRQRFHRFCRQLKLLNKTDSEFLSDLPDGKRLALWFDYFGCSASEIGNFADAVKKAGEWSILRITLNASLPNDDDLRSRFAADFERLLPINHETYFTNQIQFALLLQRIIEAATTPPIGSNYEFRMLNSAMYKDSARMLTVTGIKCPRSDSTELLRRYKKWHFYRPSWDCKPEQINLPDLSVRERLHLASLLPTCSPKPGRQLSRRLGYSIGSEDCLDNYAAFCRYFPVFSRLAM